MRIALVSEHASPLAAGGEPTVGGQNVHAHFWTSAWAAAYAIGDISIPLAVTYHALGTVERRHQGAADPRSAERQRTEPGVGKRAEVVIATGRDEVAELTVMGLDPARVEVVPGGVDVDLFHPRGVTRPPDPDGRRRLVTVGRLVPRKGFDALLAALAELPAAELVIAGGSPATALGDDPERRRLRAAAAELGVDDRVRFVGQVPRRAMPALLRSADVVACTPWYEPFGRVSLEAMACGRPVVAIAVGGLTETVRHGTSGLLVPPADHLALVGALRSLLEEPGRAAAMGRHGRRVAEREYAWPAVTAATERVYRSLRRAPVRVAAS